MTHNGVNMTLQKAFEEARELLRVEFGIDLANAYLEAAADTSYATDVHTYSETDAIRDGQRIISGFEYRAELFKATLRTVRQEYADDCYFVAGIDESDAVRRFKNKLDSLGRLTGFKLL